MKTRPLVSIATISLATLLAGQPALAGLVPTPVKVTSRSERHASGNANYFAWSRDTGATWETRVEPIGLSSYQIEQPGHAFAGQMDPTGALLPYQRVTANGARSDIRLFDMATQLHLDVPAGVNTTKWEQWPGVYGNQMTFIRDGRDTETLFLVTDLSTGDKIVLKQLDERRAFFANAPRFNGNWITWALCNRSGCHAYRYQIDTAETLAIPNPLGLLYFAPSPDLAGNVYFERSRPQCGRAARMMKWTGTGDPIVFYSFPRGTDMTGSMTFDDGASTITVFVDFFDCGTGRGDIYSFTNP